MFIEDEYHRVSDDEFDDENLTKSAHFFGSDEDSDDISSIEDGFNGWTDEEITKARFAGNLTKEMGKLNMPKQ